MVFWCHAFLFLTPDNDGYDGLPIYMLYIAFSLKNIKKKNKPSLVSLRQEQKQHQSRFGVFILVGGFLDGSIIFGVSFLSIQKYQTQKDIKRERG